MLRLCSVFGKKNGESRSLAWSTVHCHLAAKQLGKVLHNGQTKTCSSNFPGPGFVDPVEPFEDPGMMVGGNADSGIADGDRTHLIFINMPVDGDRSPWGV